MDADVREKYQRLASGRCLPRRFVGGGVPGMQAVMEVRQAEKVGKLGAALAAMTRELAGTRRELNKLQIENVVLHRQLVDCECGPEASAHTQLQE